MNIYDKISRMIGKESYEQKMYKLLSDEKYQNSPYETRDLGEDMAIVKQTIYGWWKPRFLMDHRTQCAYEFLDAGEVLVNVKDEDIDWMSLDNLPGNLIQRVQDRDGHFPTLVYGFHDSIAEVQWQINPDGRYYMDDDGFGMTDDEEIALWGKIDRAGNVVEKFKYSKD